MTRRCSGPSGRVSSLWFESRRGAGSASDRPFLMQPEASSSSTLPTFTDAVATFTAFLEREGAPAQLLRVDPEAVTSHRRQIWVRSGNGTEATRRAKARY